MKKNKDAIYDLMGVGLGPFNLSLAALADPLADLTSIFFEKNTEFAWHPGLLLTGANLQVPFLADLVTLADPKNKFSFLAYLHTQQRLYKFYFLEDSHITRQEYNHYCKWASLQMPQLHFNHEVNKVEQITKNNTPLFQVTVKDLAHNKADNYFCKHIVLGIGTVPFIPANIGHISSDYLQHSGNYLHYSAKFKSENTICVIGSGQSAAEIVLELLNDHIEYPKKIIWLTRSRGFFPMEYSKLGLEHFSPEYMNYFYSLDDETREQTLQHQDLMYKGISFKTIGDIFDKLYQLTVANQPSPLTFLAHSDLKAIHSGTMKRFSLDFTQWQLRENFKIDADAIILATGYRPAASDFLQPIADNLVINKNHTYALNKDFSIQTKYASVNKIYVQNNSLSSHGIGSPDLGLGCYRNSVILNNITQQECYPIHPQNVFQHFDFPLSVRG